MDLKAFCTTTGGDYDEIIARIPSESILKRFLSDFLEDKTFITLSQAVLSGQREEAFQAAHALKGICLNLGFGGMGEADQRLTEALRTEFSPEVPVLFETVAGEYEKLIRAISEYVQKQRDGELL